MKCNLAMSCIDMQSYEKSPYCLDTTHEANKANLVCKDKNWIFILSPSLIPTELQQEIIFWLKGVSH